MAGFTQFLPMLLILMIGNHFYLKSIQMDSTSHCAGSNYSDGHRSIGKFSKISSNLLPIRRNIYAFGTLSTQKQSGKPAGRKVINPHISAPDTGNSHVYRKIKTLFFKVSCFKTIR